MESAITKRVEQAIEERVFPGCVIGIIKDGAQTIAPFGHLRYEEGEVVHEDTVYDLASVTKSIPVAALAAELISAGELGLGDTVKKYLPELQRDFDATIEDLLRYRVRGPRLSTLPLTTFEEIRTHVLERGFDAPPGGSEYTNLPAFILGMVLERVSGESLDALACHRVFEPLGMTDTTFFPSFAEASEGKPLDDARIAPTEIVDGVEICGIVHDESARIFAKARRVAGHAGLFSTVPDLLLFMRALIAGRSSAVAEAAEAGLGWSVNEPFFMGMHASERAFGKTGFTGTSVLCDRSRGIALVILSNRTYPQRPLDATSQESAMNVFRRDVADIVFG